MGEKKIRFAIFIPAYNVEENIIKVLDKIPKKIKERYSEIIIGDDCSKDKTKELILNYKKKNRIKNLTLFSHKKNKGYGGNQKWAYNYCIKKGYDIVVMIHGDGQYAPEMIPELLKPFEKGTADMVFGSRMTGNPLKGGMPKHKFIGNKTLTWIENKVLGLELSEYHSGFRAYSCKALKRIPFNLCSDDFNFDTEILIQFKIAGLRIKETPIPTYYGNEVSNLNSLNYGLKVIASVNQYILHKTGIKKYKKFLKK